MNLDEVLGWMAVHTLNSHFGHPGFLGEDEPGDDPIAGCCIIRCGPCGALSWAKDNDREGIELLIRLTDTPRGGWSWWNDDTAAIRWDVLEREWARHKSCGTSNGELLGCQRESAEDERPEGELDYKRGRWILNCTLCGKVETFPDHADSEDPTAHNLAVLAWITHAEEVHEFDDSAAKSKLISERPSEVEPS